MIVFAAEQDTALRVYELFMKDAKDCKELNCLYGQRKHNLVLSCWQELLPEWAFVPFIPPGAEPEQQRIPANTRALLSEQRQQELTPSTLPRAPSRAGWR